MKTHDLKCWPVFFDAIQRGVKTFELRINDRDYDVGDRLHLREWSPSGKQYSGRHIDRIVTYILNDPQFGLKPGYVVLAIQPQ